MFEYLNRLYKKSKKEYCIKISKYLDNQEKKFIITANPETLQIAEKDNEMKDILLDEKNDIIPDGIAVVKAANKLGIDVTERITGIDTAVEMLRLINSKKKTLYLFGSKPEVLEKLLEVIKNDYPSIKILGAKDGYVENKDEVFKEITKLNPDVCLVAMGIPMQEFLINKHINKAKKGLYMGVGGTFDVLSGTKKRAPKIFIKLNLEWFYRLICEPSRIKRFYNNNIKFMRNISKEKKTINKYK